MDTHKNTLIKQELDLTPFTITPDLKAHVTVHHESVDSKGLSRQLSSLLQSSGPYTAVGNGESIDHKQFEIVKDGEEPNANN